tara:strand:- start:118 stop:333 length:216 start_codon:yes stop_codon:yes gene_type:complete
MQTIKTIFFTETENEMICAVCNGAREVHHKSQVIKDPVTNISKFYPSHVDICSACQKKSEYDYQIYLAGEK